LVSESAEKLLKPKNDNPNRPPYWQSRGTAYPLIGQTTQPTKLPFHKYDKGLPKPALLLISFHPLLLVDIPAKELVFYHQSPGASGEYYNTYAEDVPIAVEIEVAVPGPVMA
jgi:hypothetical protein